MLPEACTSPGGPDPCSFLVPRRPAVIWGVPCCRLLITSKSPPSRTQPRSQAERAARFPAPEATVHPGWHRETTARLAGLLPQQQLLPLHADRGERDRALPPALIQLENAVRIRVRRAKLASAVPLPAYPQAARAPSGLVATDGDPRQWTRTVWMNDKWMDGQRGSWVTTPSQGSSFSSRLQNTRGRGER